MNNANTPHFIKNKSIYDILWAIWTGIEMLIVVGFLVFPRIVGGSADHIEAGRYFLSNHGVIKETNELIYKICEIWEIVFWISFPTYILGAIGIVFFGSRKKAVDL
ncbi:MAG: hypothetical protein IJW51_06275 [Clostridia bacterium]|nr:hypothetical protein [Clostridia bacterium]